MLAVAIVSVVVVRTQKADRVNAAAVWNCRYTEGRVARKDNYVTSLKGQLFLQSS